ncbi:hypothetical protein OUZ56_011977 [Daphnia magna]|uniref:Uncharacterized protein n=1 Tax=Daphnia magna TaxID=35525 RepID=A0ABQ9Z1W5_9CRUS|nr:hypothetical protein OUZ56_011977 [Daphnia magna]
MSLFDVVVIGNDHVMMLAMASDQNDLERIHVMANDEDSHETGSEDGDYPIPLLTALTYRVNPRGFDKSARDQNSDFVEILVCLTKVDLNRFASEIHL